MDILQYLTWIISLGFVIVNLVLGSIFYFKKRRRSFLILIVSSLVSLSIYVLVFRIDLLNLFVHLIAQGYSPIDAIAIQNFWAWVSNIIGYIASVILIIFIIQIYREIPPK